jgi:transaldolase/transaldolase/glucose-6-phosphate isomerase
MNRSANPAAAVAQLGQSLWLDYIDRRILTDGTLQRLITEDRVAGLTSNPAIFEKAITHDTCYAEDIKRLAAGGADRNTLYEALVLGDIARAADSFAPVYRDSDGRDGFVSIEVSPLLARDTGATVMQARQLWQRLDRPNIMIKVPGTAEGLPAVRQLLSEGINVNVTLLFSVGRYIEVLDTYMDAMQQRLDRGLAVDRVASVASFFLSRIDVMVDPLLDAVVAAGGARAEQAGGLRGQAAVASAGFAYKRFQELSSQARWQALAAAGARPQRLLWASTGTKNPAYSDIKYVEALIADNTVNTLPLETLDAYRDHGQPLQRIAAAIEAAPHTMKGLGELGIDMHSVTEKLEREGIEKFVEPYQSLLETLGRVGEGA